MTLVVETRTLTKPDKDQIGSRTHIYRKKCKLSIIYRNNNISVRGKTKFRDVTEHKLKTDVELGPMIT